MSKKINTALILAAGKGTRLRPFTHDMPKGFIKATDESLVERSIRMLKEHGIENIVVGCGHLGIHYEGIQEKYGLKIYYNHDYASTGSLCTMILSNDLVTEDFLLLESDIMYEPRALSTLIGESRQNVVLASGKTDSGDEVYVEAKEDDELVQMSKKREDIKNLKGELTGMSRLSKDTLKALTNLVANDPEWRNNDYEQGLVKLASQQDVKVKLVEDLVWCEIDSEVHLARAKKVIVPKLKS